MSLTSDEALVLYEWIARFNKDQAPVFADQAERRVLWDIECMLEKAVDALFSPRYAELVRAARDRVRDEE